MDKSVNMEFEEWELIPDTQHNIKPDSKKDLLISDDINTNYFSDDKNSKSLDDEVEYKDIQVVPLVQSPPPVILFDKLNDDRFIIDSIKDVEEHEQSEEEHEFYKDEKNSEKKQAFWMVGALCSIGLTAATICIIVFGKGKLRKNNNQKIQFELYTDEKRIREVVKQARMNHALSAVRGASTTTSARISFGGYYDGI